MSVFCPVLFRLVNGFFAGVCANRCKAFPNSVKCKALGGRIYETFLRALQ